MINSEVPAEASRDERIDEIVEAGPHGALALSAVAAALVVAIWFAFYLFVFLPRGALQ
jgi:hypothetical protein